MKSDHAIG